MKKNTTPKQLPLFTLTPKAYEALDAEEKTRWYYLASSRNLFMVVIGKDGFEKSPHDPSHQQPWLTNSRNEARRVALSLGGGWRTIVYPYIKF